MRKRPAWHAGSFVVCCELSADPFQILNWAGFKSFCDCSVQRGPSSRTEFLVGDLAQLVVAKIIQTVPRMVDDAPFPQFVDERDQIGLAERAGVEQQLETEGPTNQCGADDFTTSSGILRLSIWKGPSDPSRSSAAHCLAFG